MNAVHDVAILNGCISDSCVHTLTYLTYDGPPVAILALGRSESSPFQVGGRKDRPALDSGGVTVNWL